MMKKYQITAHMLLLGGGQEGRGRGGRRGWWHGIRSLRLDIQQDIQIAIFYPQILSTSFEINQHNDVETAYCVRANIKYIILNLITSDICNNVFSEEFKWLKGMIQSARKWRLSHEPWRAMAKKYVN